MAESAMNLPAPEFDDIQALLRFGLGHLKRACFLLLRVKDPEAARAWLATAPVTNAVRAEPPPAQALQVALSSPGLRALDVPAHLMDGFAEEFLVGIGADPGRSRRLGDLAASDPGRWDWGAGERVPHVLLLLYANAETLPGFVESIRRASTAGFQEMARLDSAGLDEFEPFGFKDGISQPEIDWGRTRPIRDQDQLRYTNLSCLGEFVLGYPNEYGAYTDRPLITPQGIPAGALPTAEDAPDKLDLGRNGSYLVLRQLHQDVRGFWRYLDRQAGGDPELRGRFAAAMVGRRPNGDPLVDLDDPGDPNAFTYASDPRGQRCPLGAHIRRGNPRNADLPPGGSCPWSRLQRILGLDAEALDRDRVASTRFHRLLRRGRKYGPGLSMAQALADGPTGGESGLHFICLNANIGRQFEFVQAAWIAGTKFDGLMSEGDPLLGHRQPGTDGTPTDRFSMPQAAGADRRLRDLPAFVTVRGGGYFFLPGVRALRYLAAVR